MLVESGDCGRRKVDILDCFLSTVGHETKETARVLEYICYQ